MTRQERRAKFIAQWRSFVAGTIALGGDEIRKSLAGQCVTADTLGKTLLGLTPTTDNLLGRLFDDLLPPEPEKVNNGRSEARSEEDKRPGK